MWLGYNLVGLIWGLGTLRDLLWEHGGTAIPVSLSQDMKLTDLILEANHKWFCISFYQSTVNDLQSAIINIVVVG